MKVLVLAATGGAGRLIVRFRPGEKPFRRGPGLLGGERRSAGSRQNRGRCSLRGRPHLFSCGEGCRKPPLNAGPEAVPPCSALISVAHKSRLLRNDLNHLNRKRRIF